MPLKDKEVRLAYGKKYNKEWYAANKEGRRKQIDARRLELKEWFASIKNTLFCSVCNENHVSCLQFHHENPDEKDLDICRALNNGWSKKRIVDEMAKCKVLCANCHFKEHWRLAQSEERLTLTQ